VREEEAAAMAMALESIVGAWIWFCFVREEREVCVYVCMDNTIVHSNIETYG